ncbi:tetratricopeptide repeat protein [Psychrobacter sp. DM4]|uniref:tetratricopeptide repeat protein n=1 Tax=Psychrobacter sp. DM4 TaxID=3440637 RepID=UPI003F4FBEAF
MSASPLTPLDYIATGYWQDFLAGRPIAGGLAYETELQSCRLDESLDSLQRIDTLLSQIRRELIKADSWDEDKIVADERYRNFLIFLGFYAGRVLALEGQYTAHWYGQFELQKRHPKLVLTVDDFYQHMAVVYRQDDDAINKPNDLFFALEPLGLRLFGHIDRPFIAVQGGKVASGLYQAVKMRLPPNMHLESTRLPKNTLDQNLNAQPSITSPQIASEYTKSIEPDINIANNSNVSQNLELEPKNTQNIAFEHLEKPFATETDSQSLNSKLSKENASPSQSTVAPAEVSLEPATQKPQAPKISTTPEIFAQLLRELDEIEVIQTAGMDDYNRAHKVLDQFEQYIAKQSKSRLEVQFSGSHKSARQKALSVLQTSAHAGNSAAMLRLAMYELLFEGLSKDKETGMASGVSLVEQAAHKNDSRAQRLLSKLYYQGVGVTQDVDKGKYWLEQAADNGHSEAASIVNQWQQADMLITTQKQEQHSIKRYQLLIGVVVIVALLLIIFV